MKSSDAKVGDLLTIGDRWDNVTPVIDMIRPHYEGNKVVKFVSNWVASRMFVGSEIVPPFLYLGHEYGDFEISHHKTKKHHKILVDSKVLIFSGYDFRYLEIVEPKK